MSTVGRVTQTLATTSDLVSTRFEMASTRADEMYTQTMANIDDISSQIPQLDFDDAVDWCIDVITNGTTGLPETAQNNIWDYERERDLQALSDAKDRAALDWSKQNWPLPDGVLAAAFGKLEAEYMNRKIDKSRDIRVEVEKIAVEQVKFAVGKYLDVALAEIGLYEKAEEAGAHIAAQLAAGLLASAHAQASMSFSGSASDSDSSSESTSTSMQTSQQTQIQYSDSRSYNENHNYEE